MKNTRKYLVFAAVLAVLALVANGLYAVPQVAYAYKVLNFPFYLYHNADSKINNFVLSGWGGDFTALKINSRFTEGKTDENTCIQVRYIPSMGKQPAYGKVAPDMMFRNGYASLAIQSNPENRWGSLRGGYDLSSAKKLVFSARGKNGGEKIEVGMRAKNRNVMTHTLGMIELKKDWRVYEISLNNSAFDEIAGGLFVMVHSKDRIYSVEVYLDEIRFIRDEQPNFTMDENAANGKI